MSTNQSRHLIHVICVTLYKMADEREDRDATFQFIEEVQNCPDLWDVAPAAYKDTKNKRVVRSKGGISTDIRFHPNLSIALSGFSSANNIRIRHKRQLYVSRPWSALVQIPVC